VIAKELEAILNIFIDKSFHELDVTYNKQGMNNCVDIFSELLCFAFI